MDDSRRFCSPPITNAPAVCWDRDSFMSPPFPRYPVGIQHPGQHELGCIRWQPVDFDRDYGALRKPAFELPDIGFEPPDQHFVELPLEYANPTAEALRVEDFEQGGKAVRMPVMRGR